MHFKNGREAKPGDKVVGRDSYSGTPIAGTIVSIAPGATTCNAQIVPPGTPTQCVTLSDCLHADDAFPQPAKS